MITTDPPGLEAVRQLTSQGRWYLRVDLRDKSGHSADATYSNFRLGSEANHYTLKFDGFVSGAAGTSCWHIEIDGGGEGRGRRNGEDGTQLLRLT